MDDLSLQVNEKHDLRSPPVYWQECIQSCVLLPYKKRVKKTKTFL